MIRPSNALAPTSDFTGLQISVAPATLWLNGNLYIVPPTNVFLSANATSYVFLNTTNGLPGVNFTGYPAYAIPICTVSTANGGDGNNVVVLVDTRPDYMNVGSGIWTFLFGCRGSCWLGYVVFSALRSVP